MVPSEFVLANSSIIPFFGVARQYANLREEILDASDRVYKTGQVLDGAYVKEFEAQIAHRCNRRFAVAVNSCTQALIFSLLVGVEANSRVLIPGISFDATTNSVLMAGHTPVFCDTDNNALIDLESMDIALTGAGVNCVMYPNLFGHIVDYDRFRVQTEFFNSNMLVIEDAAQSFGAHYKGQPSGSLGNISVLSFDPTKNLNNYGSGGMILTDSIDQYEAFLDLRDNGKHGNHTFFGTNSKMSESDSAQMLVKLKHFDAWQARRNTIAEYYIDQLSQYVDCVLPGPDVASAWHKFVIRLSERHNLKHYLSIEGIETKIHYSKALYETPVGNSFIDVNQSFRESDAFTRECLSLPIYPELTDNEVEHIAHRVREFFN